MRKPGKRIPSSLLVGMKTSVAIVEITEFQKH